MEKSIITFENEEKTKKAIVTISYDNNEGTMDLKLDFDPIVKGDSKELYAMLAGIFVQSLTANDETEE